MDFITHVIYWMLILGLAAALICKEFIIIGERRDKNDWRRKYQYQCSARLDETEQDTARESEYRHACEIEASELCAQLKAAGIVAEGWRKAAEKGREK